MPTPDVQGFFDDSTNTITYAVSDADVFNPGDVVANGSQFDLLWNDGDEICLGELKGEVLHTPGHMPPPEDNDVSYLKIPLDTL